MIVKLRVPANLFGAVYSANRDDIVIRSRKTKRPVSVITSGGDTDSGNTDGDLRRGLFYGYVVGWLRTAENLFLTVPIDDVRTMPTRVQELLGWKSISGLGIANVGNPMALLQ